MAKLEVYEPKEPAKKQRFDGYIKHPWYLVLGAAILGGIAASLFFWRKRR